MVRALRSSEAVISKTLPAFNANDKSNHAVIQLQPDGSGDIRGTLSITQSASGSNQVAGYLATSHISLKGIAGDPFQGIVLNVVKFVPFSFDLEKKLGLDEHYKVELRSTHMPFGLTLDGSLLYGVLTNTGRESIPLQVTLGYDNQQTEEFQTTITLEVKDNTDSNVEGADIPRGYEITQRVPDMVVASDDHDFVSNGPYEEFIALYLDGRVLLPGTDYVARSGSTIITVYEQTFQSLPTGTHTLAATFQSSDGVKSVAQNFYIGQRTPSSSTESNPGNNDNSNNNSNNSGDSSSDSDSTSYSITVPKIPNCTVTVSPTSAGANSRVTLTVRPNTGYKLTSLTVTGPNGEEIQLTQVSENQYTFRMPRGNVDISVQVEADVPAGKTPFMDMLETDWFYQSVATAYERGWMVGTSANTFEPYAITSRGMIVVVLHRIAGQPTAENNDYFSDVPLDQYYASAAAWVAEQGIISGYGDGRFGPSDDLTREQIVIILHNYANLTGMDTTTRSELTQFNDLDQLSAEAQEAMSWASSVGLISGKGNGILDSAGSATRAEMAALLVRFSTLVEMQGVTSPDKR